MPELTRQEFDSEVKTRLEYLKTLSLQEKERISRAFDEIIASFPDDLLALSVKEFVEVYGGSVTAFSEASERKKNDVREEVDELQDEDQPKKSRGGRGNKKVAASKAKSKKGPVSKQTEEDRSVEVQEPVPKVEVETFEGNENDVEVDHENTKSQRMTRRRKLAETEPAIQEDIQDKENDENQPPLTKKPRGRKKKDVAVLADVTPTDNTANSSLDPTPQTSPKAKRVTKAKGRTKKEVESIEATPMRTTRRNAKASAVTTNVPPSTTKRSTRASTRASVSVSGSPAPISGPSQTIFDLYNRASNSDSTMTRRITLRSSMAPGTKISSRESIIPSLVVPLDDGVVLDLDPTVSADMLKSSVGEESRKQVVDHVKSVRDQLNSLLASLAE